MRGYSNYKNAQVVPFFERLIAVFTYLTTGIVGLLWIILAQISGKRLKYFVKFHAYQSIILAFLYLLVSETLKLLLAVVNNIPFLGSYVYLLYFYIFDFKFIFGVSIVDFIVLVVLAYLVIVSLLGKEGNIPKLSDMIRKQVL